MTANYKTWDEANKALMRDYEDLHRIARMNNDIRSKVKTISEMLCCALLFATVFLIPTGVSLLQDYFG